MKKAVRIGMTAVLVLFLMAAFYLAAILGQPQGEDKAKTLAEQPPLTVPCDLLYTDEASLQALLDAFPAPALRAAASSGLTLSGGSCRTVDWQKGLACVLTLSYETSIGPVTVQSIYPARALDVMGRQDLTLSGKVGATVAGLRSVRMENAQRIRLHAQGDEALYVVSFPWMADEGIKQLMGSFLLTEGK